MNCPACNRNLALTLSVCPSCGTMVNDSVREELALKISPLAKSIKIRMQEKQEKLLQVKSAAPVKTTSPAKLVQPPMANDLPPTNIQNPPINTQTMEISAKQTSPILVEFQNKNAVLPEWRLQLQNSVRRRNGNLSSETPATYQKVLVTKGATALKAEAIEQPATITCSNPKLENALKRIEESRQKYLTEEKPKLSLVQNQPKTFPHSVANKPQELFLNRSEELSESNSIAKPKIPFSLNSIKFKKFDTNKLPPVPAKVLSSFEKPIEIPSAMMEMPEHKNNLLEIKANKVPDVVAYEQIQPETIADEENDDRAPLVLRFNAGFFDLIIGSFLSFILLAPFTLANGNLFTFQGLLAFLATCSIVMFIYLTTTIGTMGRTIGMRLFSLEIIDIEENAYPTFHQAAVSSSVYLISLALGGVGYLTLLLNDEKRAAHDLISGTIMVKEYE